MIKKITLDPKAINLIESLRNVGYDFKSAIADLIDNSISANAAKVYVDINFDDKEFPPFILIADDGKGMDSKDLKEAMRYASSNERTKDGLGKYGLGLKTASLSQCRVLTVASRPRSRKGKRAYLNIMKWDMIEVYATNEWIVLNPKIDQLETWEQSLIEEHLDNGHGTVVLWSDLSEIHSQLYKDKAQKKERYAIKLIQDVEEHLRMVFHKFIEGSVRGKKKLTITVCQNRLNPWNPFCPSEDTTSLDIYETEIEYKDKNGKKKMSKVVISPHILPTQKEFSSEENWKDAGLNKKWNKLQGFYFYRNGRMLQAGGWSRLRGSDEHTKLLRIAVEFYPALDKNFEINISKMKAGIPSEIKETVKRLTAQWGTSANKQYRMIKVKDKDKKIETTGKGNKKTKTPIDKKIFGINFSYINRHQNRLIASKSGKTGMINISLNLDHPAMTIFEKQRGKVDQIRTFCYVLISLLEAVKLNRIKTKDIPIKSLYEELKKI